MMKGPVAIILAAGQGKRMKSEKAKVLHEVCGRPMIRYVVDAARGAGARTIVVVVGYAADQVRDYLAGRARRPVRDPDRAARHRARRQGLPAAAGRLPGSRADPGRRRAVAPARAAGRPARAASSRRAPPACSGPPSCPIRPASAASSATPPAGSSGSSRNATAPPRNARSREVNPSCYVFELPGLWDALDRIGTSNAQGEYYLTDAPEHLKAMGRKVLALNVLAARRHPRRQHPPAPRPGRRHHAGADPGPLDDRGGDDRRPAQHLHRRPVHDRPRHGDLPVHGDHGDGPDRRRTAGSGRSPTSATGRCWTTGSRSARSSRSTGRTSGAGTLARHLAYLGDAEVGRARQHRRDGRHGQFRRRAQEPDHGSATGASSAPARSWSPRSRRPGRGRRRQRRRDQRPRRRRRPDRGRRAGPADQVGRAGRSRRANRNGRRVGDDRPPIDQRSGSRRGTPPRTPTTIRR